MHANRSFVKYYDNKSFYAPTALTHIRISLKARNLREIRTHVVQNVAQTL